MDDERIRYIRFTPEFMVRANKHPDEHPDPKRKLPEEEQGQRFWRPGQRVESGQIIGSCVGCSVGYVITLQCGAKSELRKNSLPPGFRPHTVVRCTGDGCKHRVVLHSLAKNFGELQEMGEQLFQQEVAGSSATATEELEPSRC